MARLSLIPAVLSLLGAPLLAQEEPGTGRCATPDSIAVRGNQRVGDAVIRSDAQLTAGQPLNFRGVQRAIRGVFTTGQFSDVRLLCEVGADARSTLVIEVVERPLLGDLKITGVEKVPERSVSEKVDLIVNRPLDPAQLARAIQRIDSLYEKAGYFLAQVTPDTQLVDGKVNLTLRIDEGRRLAISGIRVNGNTELSDDAIVAEMKTQPEGFWWFRKGEFNEDEYARDLGERIAQLYAKRGFIDFQIVKDSLIVDRERGKALLDITVNEGKQYRVGTFEPVGNRRFSSEEISRFYPFGDVAPTITERFTDLFRSRNTNVFDLTQWEDATDRLRTAYSNEGYIYAQVRPVIDRVPPGADDSIPRVNLRWEIEERSPAIVNRVDIVGNDYTTEHCIRDALLILPGDVFNQDRLVRSYQNIANLGFFETPLPPPDTRPAGDEGDVDIVFAVKEKRTGSVNFGASVGEGTGVGGFLGLDQPNLFGKCKRASLNWQFGANQKEFSLAFTDPAIQQSRISGTVNVYHRRLRYIVEDYGRSILTGGSLQFGFPVPRSPFTRVFLSYGGERVEQSGGIFERDVTGSLQSGEGFRSTLGASLQRDTRIGLPFATAGSLQTFSSSFNGGPLGGTTSFQRYTTELKGYAPLWTVGGERPGSQPLQFTLGLSARAGAVFGDTGPFIVSQSFGLGGVMFGEPLRGYKEFSITPRGYDPNEQGQTRFSFGDAFFTTTAELGLRLNSQVYLNAFFDAGNLWNTPREFDPTRLFRGAGIGVSLITPLGPLGLDWAYGFDRTDIFGRPDPKWELHFRLGNLY
jgi:outer membrane protein insertion porin family